MSESSPAHADHCDSHEHDEDGVPYWCSCGVNPPPAAPHPVTDHRVNPCPRCSKPLQPPPLDVHTCTPPAIVAELERWRREAVPLLSLGVDLTGFGYYQRKEARRLIAEAGGL